jgi:hypothetical protein
VCHVFVDFNHKKAHICQAQISVISSLLLACISKSLPTLSFLPDTELKIVSQDLITQLYTLTKVKVPTKGSVATLKANAEGTSLSSTFKETASHVLASSPSILPSFASIGEGKYFTTASNANCTPEFLRAVPTITGNNSILKVPFLIAWSINSIDISAHSKYFSAISSENILRESIIISLYSSAISCKSAGISCSLISLPYSFSKV